MPTNVQETVQDRGAWGVAIHGVAKSLTRVKQKVNQEKPEPVYPSSKDIIFHLILHLD